MQKLRGVFSLAFILALFSMSTAQQVYNKDLMNADKLFIKKQYDLASQLYILYLQTFPGDYFASRQAAVCLDYLNDHYNAAEYWAAVIESSDCTENDLLFYARCFLQNDRQGAAGKIFPLLSKSKNPHFAAWGKAWLSPAQFYADSSLYHLSAAVQLNSDLNEACPYFAKGKLVYTIENSGNPRIYTPGTDPENRVLTAVNARDTLFFSPSDFLRNMEKTSVFGQVAFTPDGLEMYFTKAVSNTEAGIKSPFAFSRYQIFVLTLSSLNNSKPEIKPFSFNNSLYNYLHPDISEDGRYLYFSSDMKGSLGGTDIYVSEKINGEWTKPVNAGPAINSPGNELFPRLLANGDLYYSSDGLPGLGGLDIFVSEKREGKNQKARNPGFPLNTRYDDFGAFFTSKNTGYLSSNRLKGTDDDLFYFSVSR